MGILIILVIVVAIILIVKFSSQNSNENRRRIEPHYEVKIEYPDSAEEEKGNMVVNEDGSITLSTGKKTRATLIGASPQIANDVMSICDSPISFYEWSNGVRSAFMLNGIELKEVAKFRSKVCPIVEKRINGLIAEDEEWETLGEKDKKDKEEEYRYKSMVEFGDDVSPTMSGALNHLAFAKPIQVPLFREMVDEYGAANVDTYCQYHSRKNPIITIEDVKYRKPFEDLVKVGLAYTGKDMSVEELLSTLTLNDLNRIASAESKFTRKDKAIKYLAESDDIASIIDKNVTLRAIFSLKPLPEKYKEFDFDKYSAAKEYYECLADVFVSLYKGYSPIAYK